MQYKSLGLLALAAVLTLVTAQSPAATPIGVLPSYIPVSTKPISAPIFQDGPVDPAVSCSALLAAVAGAAPGSLTSLTTAAPVIMSSKRYGPGTTAPTDRTVYVGASLASASPPAKLGVVLYWHSTGNTPAEIQPSAFAGALKDTIVIAPRSALAPLQFEWHLVLGTAMHDVWLADDLVACLAQSPRVDTARIFTAGFSAGAIHSTYLSLFRPHYLAGAVIWSGGMLRSPLLSQNATVAATVGAAAQSSGTAAALAAYGSIPASRAVIPTIVTSGGPKDNVVVAFTTTTILGLDVAWTQAAIGTAASGSTSASPVLPAVWCTHTLGHRMVLGAEVMVPFLTKLSFTDNNVAPVVAGTPADGYACQVVTASLVGFESAAVVKAAGAALLAQGKSSSSSSGTGST
ncbi:hypothetical protein BC828DRAFT_386621, partial [Blastocladiella britannica]